MYSQRALSKISKIRKTQTPRHFSQFSIPTQEQATQREQKLKDFHNRNINVRRKSLENMCKQNYRIYFNLNQQKSSYNSLFKDRSSLKSKSKEKGYHSKMKQLPKKEQMAYFKAELTKINRLKNVFQCSLKEKQTTHVRKQGIRQILTERNKNIEMSRQIKQADLQLQNDI